MALNLLVLYIAIVLAMTFYVELGYRFALIFSGALAQSVTEIIAFVVILVVMVAILTFVVGRTFKNTELPGVRQIDQLGGMVIGFVLICTWIGLAIIAIGFVLSATDVGESSLRTNMLHFYSSSFLIPIFYKLLPVVLFTLRPWMPKGLPPDVFSQRFF